MNTAFQNHVADPLAAIIGGTLTEVDYWILESDKTEFMADRPNASGLAAVSIRFGSGGLEITWNWDKSLRAEWAAYHIQVAHTQGWGLAGLWNTDALSLVSATQSVPWCDIIGETLQAVSVSGLDRSPQAIRFEFRSSVVVVTTGYSGDPLSLGDGDELLVLTEKEWAALTQNGTQRWQQLWAVSTPVLPALAARGEIR